ncbi:hypothetical protein ACK2M7_11165 [Chryseobacterium sp. TY4]
MLESIASLTNEEIPLPMLIFLLAFTVGIALFHYIISSALLRMNKKLALIFFALDPAIIYFVWLINSRYSFLALLILSLSVFLLGIIGIIVSSFRNDDSNDYVSNRSFNEKYNVKPKSNSRKAKELLFTIIFFLFAGLSLYFFGQSGVILVFISIFVAAIMASTNNKRFLKTQASLPTSKIRSVAMGLAELQGKCHQIKPSVSPIGSKNCIGFRYTIEDESTDKDGKTSYTTRLDKTVCEDFTLTDDTGSILVKGANISFLWLEEDQQYYDNNQRFTQYLLKDEKEVLLIGNVSLENNKPIVAYDNYNKTFGVGDVDKVNLYNDSVPLLNQAKVYAAVFAILMAIIIVTPMSMDGRKLVISKPNFSLFETKKPKEEKSKIEDINHSYDDDKHADEATPAQSGE